MARALWRSVLLSLLLRSASGFLAPRPRSGSSGRAGRTALASSDPLLSLPIPGSARARLEVPGWDAQRQLLRELVDEARPCVHRSLSLRPHETIAPRRVRDSLTAFRTAR